jgi:hypothetical protein
MTIDWKSHVQQLYDALDQTHKVAQIEIAKRHETNAAQRAKHAKVVDFAVGNYVLKSKVIKKPRDNKLHLKWHGPYRVVKALNSHVYEVQHLLKADDIEPCHVSRLKLYSCDLEITELLEESIAYQDSMRYTIKAIVDHRYNVANKAFEMKISWLGFEAHEDSWEPLQNVVQDAPAVVTKYVQALPVSADKDILLRYLKDLDATVSSQILATEKRKERKKEIAKGKKRKVSFHRDVEEINLPSDDAQKRRPRKRAKRHAYTTEK